MIAQDDEKRGGEGGLSGEDPAPAPAPAAREYSPSADWSVLLLLWWW